ncbi:hypothetical protein RSAG8_09542, partial [Rhizoctonia solani AG-8 WAC10335]
MVGGGIKVEGVWNMTRRTWALRVLPLTKVSPQGKYTCPKVKCLAIIETSNGGLFCPSRYGTWCGTFRMSWWANIGSRSPG